MNSTVPTKGPPPVLRALKAESVPALSLSAHDPNQTLAPSGQAHWAPRFRTIQAGPKDRSMPHSQAEMWPTDLSQKQPLRCFSAHDMGF